MLAKKEEEKRQKEIKRQEQAEKRRKQAEVLLSLTLRANFEHALHVMHF